MNIPSYQCQLNDKISIKKMNNNSLEINSVPSHLDFNVKSNLITVLNDVRHEEVGLKLNELLIVEYYSRS